MPATATPADRFDIATGLWFRTCPLCSTELERTGENFYQRAGRPMENRCQPCRRRRDAEVRAARRAGNPVRGRTGRKFGVEIEFIGSMVAVERELIARGVPVRNMGYTHRVMPQWKIVRDGSLGSTGGELVSPPLSGAAGLRQLKLACEALDAAGVRVNRSCGLHVHHDVSDLDCAAFGRLFRGWAGSQHAIDMLVAPSRRNSQWAMPLNERNVLAIERATSVSAIRSHAAGQNRYQALNVECFPRYGTVEVRQHQGTLNFDKIAAWLAFGQAMIARAKRGGDLMVPANADALLDELASFGLTAAQVTYLKGRAAHFAGRAAGRRVAA